MKQNHGDKHDAPASGKLVNIFQLAQLKGRSVRELRSMQARGQLTHYKLAYRTIVYDPADFDRDIKPFKVQSVATRNGK